MSHGALTRNSHQDIAAALNDLGGYSNSGEGGEARHRNDVPPKAWGPFHIVEVDNDLSLDFHDVDGDIASQHYAFLITEPEFDEVLGRIHARGLDYWADPALHRAGEINHNDGGRGVYWRDPDGHVLEVITRPYGSGAS